MFTWIKREQVGYKMINGVKKAVYAGSGRCLSTDTKPTDGQIANGSDAIEMDTSKIYFFDEDNATWKEF